MNSHTHKLFFMVLLSTPTIILSSDEGSENPTMYPNVPVTEIEPLPTQELSRREFSKDDENALKALLAKQTQNAERAATTKAEDASFEILMATEPASQLLTPATKKESPKTNRK